MSGNYNKVFGSFHHVLLPVVHVETFDQALRNVALAQRCGAHGVWLINHSIYHEELYEIYTRIRAKYPKYWIGLNCLDLTPERAIRTMPADVDGYWADNASIDESADKQPRAERVLDAIRATGWKGLYFGGVAFKYQRKVDDLQSAGAKAAPYMDVITTSGPGTGMSALVSKIQYIKDGAGDKPVAIASGVTPDNVSMYMPYATCFLVATGISSSFTELDESKMKSLLKKLK